MVAKNNGALKLLYEVECGLNNGAVQAPLLKHMYGKRLHTVKYELVFFKRSLTHEVVVPKVLFDERAHLFKRY